MQSHALWISLSASYLLFSLPVRAEEAFSFDTAGGRLPKNVVPVSYVIEIAPDAATLTNNGKESVELQFRAATDTLVFNSLNERLSDVRLDGRPVKSVTSDDGKQLTTVTLAQPAAVGKHKLSFSYLGRIETHPQGLFVQHYEQPGGAKGVLLTTQMEPTDARRMFPCWDEPAFRATFQLTATVPSKWATVANTPIAKRVPHGALVTTTFQPSPKMASYLIEFTAGDLAQVQARSGGKQFAVWTVRGLEGNGQVALANAQTILVDYEEYFAYPFPLPKLDSIAIPGGFNGAMENWGAITYNDQTLLVSPSSTLDDKRFVFTIQAHEMAHQWFGDLVTMGWWDDLWLNESFASWMAAKETQRRHPEWHWWEGQDARKESAMFADARASSHAIQQHVTDELEAANAFDPDITYNKGQAILRMFEAYLGEEVFRSGVRSYVRARAFSNATTTDLWNGLGTAGEKSIARIAEKWVAQPGFPLVTASASCDSAGGRTVTLTQSRFLLQGADPNLSHWSVPLQIRLGSSGAPRGALLRDDGQKVAAGRCGEPLSLNADAIGYYRVRYDAKTLETNTKSFSTLSAGDRIALLDDQWALVGSGKEPLPSYLALANSMGGDLDVRAWQQVEGALHTIEYDERGTPGHNAFTAYARSVIKPAFDALGWDARSGDTADVQKLRRALIRDMSLWGDVASIAEARKRFDAFMQDHSRLSPDDQETILNIVARNADAATFEKLHGLAKTAKDGAEMLRFYSALMQVEDESLAEQAAQVALSSEIPHQADNMRLQFVGLIASRHQKLAWTTFREHHDMLLGPHEPYGSFFTAQSAPEMFWSGIPMDELEKWIRAHVPAEMAVNVDQGLQAARFMLAEKQTLVGAADAYLQAGGPAGR
jgi:aminopeptidase N